MVDLHPKTCNLCRGKVVLVPNAKVYGKSYGSGMCYLCTKCGAFVGTHEPRPDEALGLLADSRMRNAKKRCHILFDRHWMDKEQKRTYRTAMYRWLADKMNIDVEDCHFGHFTLEQLEEAYMYLIRVKELKMHIDKSGKAVFSSRS